MQVSIQKATNAKKALLSNLLELYQHDFTEFTPFEKAKDIDDSGRYGYKYLESYWRDKYRYPFLVRVNGKIAGFVLVNLNYEEAEESNTHGISEFFVMRKYRKQGIGRQIAYKIFDMFPGKWQIGHIHENIDAQQFWRKVVGSYTNGRYTESLSEKGPRLHFENSRQNR